MTEPTEPTTSATPAPIEGPWLVCPDGTSIRLEAIASLAPVVTEETGHVQVRTVDGATALATRIGFDDPATATRTRGQDRRTILDRATRSEVAQLRVRIAEALDRTALT